VTRSPSVGRLLTLVYSFSMWIPAIGVPAGAAHGVQLGELMSPLLALWLLTTRTNRFDRNGVVMLVGVVAIVFNWLIVYAANTNVAQSGAILGYYLAIAFPALLCGVLIFLDEDLTCVFIRGAVVGAVFTAVLCLMQAVLPRSLVDFRNNLSFRLPPQDNRSFGLFPEASVAATSLTFAIATAVSGLLFRTVRERFLELGPLRGRAWAAFLAVLFVAALVTTRSTSVLVMLPALVAMASFRFFRGSLGKKIAFLSIGAVALAIGGTFYYLEVYSVRMENSAAMYSGTDRLVSILGAYEKLRDSNFLGAGLGANNDIADYAARAAGELQLQTVGEINGVNSFVFGRCLEEGVVMIVVFAVVIFRIVRAAFSRERHATSGVMALLAVDTLFSAFWVAGYRGLLMSWLLIPLGMSLERRTLARREYEYQEPSLVS
jgi:hypothetical protein